MHFNDNIKCANQAQPRKSEGYVREIESPAAARVGLEAIEAIARRRSMHYRN